MDTAKLLDQFNKLKIIMAETDEKFEFMWNISREYMKILSMNIMKYH